MTAALVARNTANRTQRTVDDDAKLVEHLVGWLRRLIAVTDTTVGGALTRAEGNPASHLRLHELAQALDRRAAADVAFRSDLEALIARAQALGIDTRTITRTAWGTQTAGPHTGAGSLE